VKSSDTTETVLLLVIPAVAFPPVSLRLWHFLDGQGSLVKQEDVNLWNDLVVELKAVAHVGMWRHQ